MNLWMTFKQAIRALGQNWFRSLLTMFGIVWGIATVIILVAMVQGFYEETMQRFEAMGANSIYVEYRSTYEDGDAVYAIKGQLSDTELLESSVPAVKRALPFAQDWIEMKGTNPYPDHNPVGGTTPDIRELRKLPIAQGRFFNIIDMQEAKPVCVVGSEASEELFGGNARPGMTLRIGDVPFRIIGVLQETGSWNDHHVYIPITAMQDYLTGPNSNFGGDFELQVQMANLTSVDPAKEEIKRVLAAEHGIAMSAVNSAFQIRDFIERREEQEAVFGGMIWIFRAIGLLTLLVGGVGVMNIMLVSVGERTREIGLRKALGSPKRTILAQFLSEALFITIIGGVIGILVGVGITDFIAGLELGDEFPSPIVTQSSIYVGIIVLGIVGIASGIYPAWRAAHLDPIDALRTE